MARVCIGVITGAHGIRGTVRIKSFTEHPTDVTRYGLLENETGRSHFHPRSLGMHKGCVLAAFEGVSDRNAAEALKGTKLYVPREALPETAEDEFYYSDLVGLRALSVDGVDLGQVKGVFDFGGGDVIEIVGSQGSRLYPFTRQVVPTVDITEGRLVIDPPVEITMPTDEMEQDDGKRD